MTDDRPASATPTGPSHGRALRIRLGLALVIASWLPVAQAVIWATSASDGRADRIRAVIWGIQIGLGLIGAAVAGAETIRVARSVGWRRAPAVVWRLLRSPDAPPPIMPARDDGTL
ncbi:MAG TPA: hypothetical protein VFQ71_11665 [Gaiellales bacterium]|nr:hypothetical protein [Gaiellales bacterium]